MIKTTRLLSLATVACLALTACEDSDDPVGVEDDENFVVVLAPEDGSTTGPSIQNALVPEALRATIGLESVTSIILPIGAVQAHQVGGTWVNAGTVNADIDLLALPADGIELVDSELPEGQYNAVRFFLTDDAQIVLGEEIVVGRTTYAAGSHDLRIPSAEQAGVRLNVDFAIDETGTLLTVLFDDDATVRRVTATGSGTLMISPVLRVVDEDGDDIGEIDDDDDEDFEGEFEGVVESTSSTGFTLTNGQVVTVTADTEFEGDILSLDEVTAALAAGETVEAEGEGVIESDGSIVAAEVDFEVEDDDTEEVEVEGTVQSVNRGDLTFVVDDNGTSTTVVMVSNTEIEGDFDTFEEMADAFDAGAAIEVEAEGALDAGGNLMATDVDFDVEEEDDEEFDGTVSAVSVADGTVTVALDGGGSLTVAITGTTTIDAGGDFDTLAEVAAALSGGATVEVEGEGTLDTTTGVLTATEIKFESD